MNLPDLVYHADWSIRAQNRWCAKATLKGGRYTAFAPEPVGELGNLPKNLGIDAGDSETVFAGFDFPIGVPEHYANRANISRFPEFLKQLGTGDWEHFYSVCEYPKEVSLHRPFYPLRYEESSCSQKMFLKRHEAANMDVLLRRCELGGEGQKRACSLFWTLGGNQVGKAAIVGWRDMLVPALQTGAVRVWPFEGSLESLLQPGRTVIAETYPAECYRWFGGEPPRSKREIECRVTFGTQLLDWAHTNRITITPLLEDAIEQGFPAGEDDAFDAVVGLFGMLQVCLGERASGDPQDEAVSKKEGWILGRQSTAHVHSTNPYSSATDAELRDWLRWASESGEAPTFIRAVAETASVADLEEYALLRPVLLKLRRRSR